MAPVTITWHHGPDFAPGAREMLRGKLCDFGVVKPEDADALMGMAGSMLIGSAGALLANDHSVGVTALPHDSFAELNTTRPEGIPASRGIYRDWTDACRGGKPHVLASFDNGGPLSELLMLGNIATLFPGETLSYAPAVGQITSHAEANRKRSYAYREGWVI